MADLTLTWLWWHSVARDFEHQQLVFIGGAVCLMTAGYRGTDDTQQVPDLRLQDGVVSVLNMLSAK